MDSPARGADEPMFARDVGLQRNKVKTQCYKICIDYRQTETVLHNLLPYDVL